MTPQVFISHSSKDKAVADAICHQLESAEIPCWMAPRNIEYGSDWTEGIMRGITACRVFVLVFSENANGSGHVRREVAKAFSLGLQVIPFRIEDTLPQTSLSYFLETVHWLDAVTQPLEKHLNSLTERVKKLLANGDLVNNPDPAALGATAYPGLATPVKRRNWLPGAGLAIVAGVIIAAAWLYVAADRTAQQKSIANGSLAEISAKSVAVLPFESISAGKEDGYFADGVQDEILNNLAKIAQLKVISRTSVMQYRADTKRDMRQIAYALGVANVLEGTVRRDGNRVRVSAQLVDARSDNAVWADSYDRDLTDIFTIQSEVAQTIADKLSAALSPEEKQRIEEKPTKNLEAYDMYLRAKEKLDKSVTLLANGHPEEPLRDAADLLQQAVQEDPNFAKAHCLAAFAHDVLYLEFDPTSARRALADEAINKALRLQPDAPEVRLAHASHLYRAHRDYDGARAQLAIAKRELPNNSEVIYLEASMDRRQGNFDRAIQHFEEAAKLDPLNPLPVLELAETLSYTRQFSAAERVWDRLITLVPDQPMARAQKEAVNTIQRTADDKAYRSALDSLPTSIADNRQVLSGRLNVAIDHRDWYQAKQLLEKMNRTDDAAQFAYAARPVPVSCYSILIARLQGEVPTEANPAFADTRQRLSRKVETSPVDAPAHPLLLSNLAVVDALLGHKEDAKSEGKRAVEMVPITKDAVHGARVTMNLAVVYAWTDEPDLAFQLLDTLAKTPYGLFFNDLKLSHYFDPLRKDPRYNNLLAALEPHE
jgi:TolB-like protein/Flp pilus assembly protein TadD